LALRLVLVGYGGILPAAAPDPSRTDIRGLFAGGTLCEQARMLLARFHQRHDEKLLRRE
jgi:hypothetical protein